MAGKRRATQANRTNGQSACGHRCTGTKLCEAPTLYAGGALPQVVRIAHCVVGVAHHRYGPKNWPIISEKMYEPMARWLEDLKRYNIQSDVFLHLDMALWPMSYPYYRKKNWIKTIVLGSESWREQIGSTPYSALNGTISALKPVSVVLHNATPYCKTHNCSCSATFPRWWEQVAKNQLCFDAVTRHELRLGFKYDYVTKMRSDYNFDEDCASAKVVASAVHASMQPMDLKDDVEDPLRTGSTNTEHYQTFPSNSTARLVWDGQRLAPVSSYGGSVFGPDGIKSIPQSEASTSINDAFVAGAPWRTSKQHKMGRSMKQARNTRHIVRLKQDSWSMRPSTEAGTQPSTVFIAPWGNGMCYAASDWFVLAPRRAAPAYFNFSADVTCDWLRCLRQRYNKPGYGQALSCMFNERLLLEWMLHLGIGLSALPDQRVHIPSVVSLSRIRGMFRSYIVLEEDAADPKRLQARARHKRCAISSG